MMMHMNHSDNIFIGEPFKPLGRNENNIQKGGHEQTSMKSLVNFRDHLGRTPLHIAAIWGNKDACETLLYLKANCLIEDGAGYKPIDFVDPNSSLADLFKNWMPRTTPPTLFPFGEVDQSIKSGTQMKQSLKNTTSKIKSNGIDVSELRQMSTEAIISARLNDTQDNYFQAAIKAKNLESAVYLRKNVENGFPLSFQNIQG